MQYTFATSLDLFSNVTIPPNVQCKYFITQCYGLNCVPQKRFGEVLTLFSFFKKKLYSFSPCISVWEVSTDQFPSSLILSSAVLRLLMSHHRHTSSLSQYLLFISSIHCDSFRKFPPLCLHYPSLNACHLLFP